jgi:hypothetical protein
VIEGFAASRSAEVLARLTEMESGRKADRPELAKALRMVKATCATLIIVKPDRLCGNAAFLLALRDSEVSFFLSTFERPTTRLWVTWPWSPKPRRWSFRGRRRRCWQSQRYNS